MRHKPLTKAIHEAGHAVAAVHHDIDFEFVTIVPDDGADGKLKLDGKLMLMPVPDYITEAEEAEARLYWENYLIVAMAGPAAHKKRHPYAHPWGYAMSDFSLANGIINDMLLGADVARAYWKYIEARARHFVEASWHKIEVVAAALVEHGTLDREMVCDIILDAARKKINQ